MMRKSEYALWTLLVLAVLAAGSTMVGLARSQTASAANSEIYRQLDLFGEVLERVRADYVEKPEDAKLVFAAPSCRVPEIMVEAAPSLFPWPPPPACS